MVYFKQTDRTGDEGPKYSPEGIDVELSTEYKTQFPGNVYHGPNASQELKGDLTTTCKNDIASPTPEWQMADNTKMGNGTDGGYGKVGTGTP